MPKYNYIYVGPECSVWDEKGGIFLNSSTSQKELEYLCSKGYDGIAKTELSEPKKQK